MKRIIKWLCIGTVFIASIMFAALTLADKEKQAEPLPPMPKHWRVRTLEEPVFSSHIRVVESGNPEHPTLLLVHGLGQIGLRDWDNVIPALEQQYHVITLDLPGFGQSQVPEGRYTPSNYAKVLHWLKTQYSERPIYVVGHSMGGAVVLRYGHLFPEDIEKAVMVDAAGILQRTAFVKHSARVAADKETLPGPFSKWVERAKDIGATVIERVSSGPDPSSILQSNDVVWNAIMSQRPNMNAAMSLVEENFTDAVFNFTPPAAIIWGEKDNVAPLRTGEMLAKQLKQVEAFYTIADAGHVPMKTHPAIFNEQLLQALKSKPPNVSASQRTKPSNKNGHCQNNSHQFFEGEYNRIKIENCSEVQLNYVTAAHLDIRNSNVNIKNSQLMNDDRALNAEESVVVSTNLTVEGTVRSKGSRLDFAGAQFYANGDALLVDKPSRLILSTSQLHSDRYQGPAHGDFKIKASSLDRKLVKESY